ncbi:hypothetical protein Q7P37_005012 [Cladosporium fusiforme]
MVTTTALLALVGTASAGTLLWDGRANDYDDSSFLDDWSWSNQDGPYQWYIHGDGDASSYVNLGKSNKNPADTGSKQGIQITNDKTSSWNGQTMLRTELIPQTSAAINEGKVYYHFSMQHTDTNPPEASGEHQINFFESHFTEMKYGLVSGAEGTSDNRLQWFVDGKSQWDEELTADTWHNIAYGIDFSAGEVEFYHSTGSDDLEKIAGPVSASTDSNGADWHLGVLRLTNDGATEDWNFSGVYIESGDLTTSVVSPGGSSSDESSSDESSSAAPKVDTDSASTTSKSSGSSPTSAASKVSSATSKASSSAISSATSSSLEPSSSCQVEYVYV